jgi:hypothetical protein
MAILAVLHTPYHGHPGRSTHHPPYHGHPSRSTQHNPVEWPSWPFSPPHPFPVITRRRKPSSWGRAVAQAPHKGNTPPVASTELTTCTPFFSTLGRPLARFLLTTSPVQICSIGLGRPPTFSLFSHATEGKSIRASSVGTPTAIKKLESWKRRPTHQGFLEAEQKRIWEPKDQPSAD